MKQTAVEWLAEALAIAYKIEEISLRNFTIKKLIKQAKEMELSQLVECWNTAHQAGRFEGKGIAEKDWQTFEQYYNETFKSE
jgi:hypothetical protein